MKTYLYSDEKEGGEMLFKSKTFTSAKKDIIKCLKKDGDFWLKAIKRVEKYPTKVLQELTKEQLSNLKSNYKKFKT